MRILIILVAIISLVGCTAMKPIPETTDIESIQVGDLVAINTHDGNHFRIKVTELSNLEIEGTRTYNIQEKLVILKRDVKEVRPMKEQFHCDFLCGTLIGAGIWALIL